MNAASNRLVRNDLGSASHGTFLPAPVDVAQTTSFFNLSPIRVVLEQEDLYASVIARASNAQTRKSVPMGIARSVSISESKCFNLAKSDPTTLINLISKGFLKPTDLTFAAEALGQVRDARAKSLLLSLLEHDSPIVREGAVYGISGLLGALDVKAKLKEMSRTDPNIGVREAASEALDTQ